MGKVNICLTGANGFVGKNLLNQLKTEKQINPILFNGNLLIKKDIENFFIQNKKISYIIHLAGAFNNVFNELMQNNVIATDNLLYEAVKNKVERIIFSSSGAVYGNPIKKKSRETDNPNPSTYYGLSKLYAEQCIKYYGLNCGLNYTILRFSNIYGIGNTKGVIYNFLENIKLNKPLEIFGNGNQKRDFIYIDDAVNAISKSINYNGSKNIFNISGKEIFSLNDIKKLLDKEGLKFNTVYKPSNTNNKLEILALDISKSKKILKWHPKISLAQGIKKIVNNYLA